MASADRRVAACRAIAKRRRVGVGAEAEEDFAGVVPVGDHAPAPAQRQKDFCEFLIDETSSNVLLV